MLPTATFQAKLMCNHRVRCVDSRAEFRFEVCICFDAQTFFPVEISRVLFDSSGACSVIRV